MASRRVPEAGRKYFRGSTPLSFPNATHEARSHPVTHCPPQRDTLTLSHSLSHVTRQLGPNVTGNVSGILPGRWRQTCPCDSLSLLRWAKTSVHRRGQGTVTWKATTGQSVPSHVMVKHHLPRPRPSNEATTASPSTAAHASVVTPARRWPRPSHGQGRPLPTMADQEVESLCSPRSKQ